MAGNSFAKEIKGMSNRLYFTVTDSFQKCNSLLHNVSLQCQNAVSRNKPVVFCHLFAHLHTTIMNGEGKNSEGLLILCLEFIWHTYNLSPSLPKGEGICVLLNFGSWEFEGAAQEPRCSYNCALLDRELCVVPGIVCSDSPILGITILSALTCYWDHSIV